MPRAVLGLGSNLGARAAMLRAATAILADQPGLRVLARSLVYETPPLGPPQPHYLNAALLVEWAGSLSGLFAVTCHAEQLLGRERRERWGARTLDVDILLWSGGPVHTPRLTVPHPGAFQRTFVLAPLRDVLPNLSPELTRRLADLGGIAPGKPLLAEHPPWRAHAGATARAQSPSRSDDSMHVQGSDLAELLSETVAAIASGAPRARCLAAMPFALPREPEPALHALVRHVSQLPTWGFYAQRGVITQADDVGFRGVLLGEHGPGQAERAPAAAHFFADSERMWVRLSGGPA
jgi:2-amino-4-hydroxy-6-hydroxymethyldihydropteridine diphosphokinase